MEVCLTPSVLRLKAESHRGRPISKRVLNSIVLVSVVVLVAAATKAPMNECMHTINI